MDADWSSLPLDILSAIELKLETCEDFIYFSAVCLWWNHVSSLSKNLRKANPVPWLLLAENTNENPNYLRKIFNFTNNMSYKLNLPETFGTRCLGSAYGWVAMVDRALNVQLFNPMTKAQISFPSLKTTPEIYGDKRDPSEDFFHRCLRLYCQKLIVLKVPQNGHYEFVVLILCGSNTLAFARHGDPSWTLVFVEENEYIVDVVSMGDYVFALYDNGAIVYWNVKEFNSLDLIYPMAYSPANHEITDEFKTYTGKFYLVQSDGDLLMLLRVKEDVANSDGSDYDYDIVYRTICFLIYRLNHVDKSWEEVEDIGGVALFVGGNYSMSVAVEHAKCLQSNCIYFTDDEHESWLTPIKFGGHDMGVYNIKNDELWPFYDGNDTRSSFCTPIWFTPQL